MKFFKFYKYLFKKDDKKYDLALNNYGEIMCIPLLFTILITGIFVLLPRVYMAIPLVFTIFSVINFAILIVTYKEAREIEEMKEIERQREARERAERIAREYIERLKREREERLRQERESFERWKQKYTNNNWHDDTSNNRSGEYVDQNMKNAMHLMGLKEGFTKQDVKSAYRRLSKVHHPDVGGLEENFKKLNKAYNYIMDRI